MTLDEERLLVKRAARGDTQAFEKIVTSYEKTVYNLSLKMLGSRQDAEDASQETFIKVWSALEGFKGNSRLSVWIYRICSNVCIDMLRRRREEAESLTVETEEGQEQVREIPDERYSPETVYDGREKQARLRQALDSLSEHYRQSVLMRDVWGMSYEEIASELGVELATVKTRIFRGRRRLAEILGSDGNFFEKAPSKEKEKGGEQA